MGRQSHDLRHQLALGLPRQHALIVGLEPFHQLPYQMWVRRLCSESRGATSTMTSLRHIQSGKAWKPASASRAVASGESIPASM